MYVDIVWQMGKYKYGSSGHSHSGNILFLVYTFLYLSADVIIAIYLTNLIHWQSSIVRHFASVCTQTLPGEVVWLHMIRDSHTPLIIMSEFHIWLQLLFYSSSSSFFFPSGMKSYNKCLLRTPSLQRKVLWLLHPWSTLRITRTTCQSTDTLTSQHNSWLFHHAIHILHHCLCTPFLLFMTAQFVNVFVIIRCTVIKITINKGCKIFWWGI